jgi:hypothetical protein
MSDEEVIAEHDAKWNVAEGGSFYLDELRRREAERAETAAYELARSSHELATRAYELARQTYWLAIAAAVFSGVSTIAAIVGIGVAVGTF